LAVLAISCGTIAEVRAGTITAAEVISGCGTAMISTLPNPQIEKSFDRICSMDIIFTVTNNTALGRANFTEGVLNSMGPSWIDFHMQLGFGSGSQFTPAPANCGPGFATLPPPVSFPFRMAGVSSNAIDWSGGTVPQGMAASFRFDIIIPDFAPCIPTGSQLPNGYIFTLRETPSTVPEPATMLLLSTGLAGVVLEARRQRKAKSSKT